MRQFRCHACIRHFRDPSPNDIPAVIDATLSHAEQVHPQGTNQQPLQGGILFSSRIRLHFPMHPNLRSSTMRPDQSFHSETTLTFQRTQARLNMACPVMFAGVPFIGEGTLHNLSRTGCRVECDRTVLRGSYMTVRLLLPDDRRSLIVDLAAVRWVSRHCFGIEFLRLPASEQTRLEQFLRHHHG